MAGRCTATRLWYHLNVEGHKWLAGAQFGTGFVRRSSPHLVGAAQATIHAGRLCKRRTSNRAATSS